MNSVLKQRTKERDDARNRVDQLQLECAELEEQLSKERQSRMQQSSSQSNYHSQNATEQVSPSEAAQKIPQIELENELKAAKRKISDLKTTISRLSKQLQAEKDANVGKSPAEKHKDYDQDDEEPLPGAIKREPMGSSRNGSSLPIRPRIADPMPRTPPRSQPPQSPFETSTSKAKAKKTKATKASQSTLNSTTIQEMSNKRKRPYGEDVEDNLADSTFESARTPQRTKRSSASIPSEQEYTFKAIAGYAKDGREKYIELEDVKKCAFLCGRIDQTTDIWVHGAEKGHYWIHELMRKDIDWTSRPCITKKLVRRKTRRRPGDNGWYACLDCVANGRPCFTVDFDETGLIETEGGLPQLILLPMHKHDRKDPLIRGESEVRYWLNDFTEFEDKDVRKKEEGDEDFLG